MPSKCLIVSNLSDFFTLISYPHWSHQRWVDIWIFCPVTEGFASNLPLIWNLFFVTSWNKLSEVSRSAGYLSHHNYNDEIKWKHFRVTGPMCGVFTGHLWNPLTKASDTEFWCFHLCATEQTVKQTTEIPVIWDVMAIIVTAVCVMETVAQNIA